MKVLFVRSANRGTDPISSRQGESLAKNGVEVLYYDIIGKGVKGYLRNVLKVRRLAREAAVDLIHAHYGMSGMVASLSFSGRPVITSLMGSEAYSMNGAGLFLIRFFSRFCWSVTIVKSEKMKLKMNIGHVSVIPNGVDMDSFYPIEKGKAIAHLGWDKDLKHITFASDPSRPEKNFPLAGKALDIVSGRLHPDKAEIHCLMNIEPSKVVYYYSASDLFLMTSTHEGSPNTVKEAMACNCPVISTDVGDVKDVISGTEGCHLVPFDPDETASRILSVLKSGKRTNGRNSILHLDSNAVASRIIDLYRKVIAG